MFRRMLPEVHGKMELKNKFILVQICFEIQTSFYIICISHKLSEDLHVPGVAKQREQPL